MSKKDTKIESVAMVQTPSVKYYFNHYIVEGLKGKEKIQEIDLIDIKQKLLKAFKNEIFGQVIFKFGKQCEGISTEDLAKMEGVQNILTQAFRKWRRLCILCSEAGLGSFFQLEDLKSILEDQGTVVISDHEEIDVTGQVPEGTVIVDEKTMEPAGEVTSGHIQVEETADENN